ncbi:MAG TPA: F0F1 ATP synthase subunit delta [Vicinamibacterales bacterium]|jgi:F-type H+-transporting ATPase subunit delta
MTRARQAARDARELWRLCRVNGSVDESRVRLVVSRVLASGNSRAPGLLRHFLRLLKLDVAAHSASVASAAPLDPAQRAAVESGLAERYGPGIATTFEIDPTLIAGMRVRVGSDVYDGSVKAGLAALESRF